VVAAHDLREKRRGRRGLRLRLSFFSFFFDVISDGHLVSLLLSPSPLLFPALQSISISYLQFPQVVLGLPFEKVDLLQQLLLVELELAHG
jgi:hypothetical protein